VSPAAIGRRTFAALANPNYRRWYAGQGISLVGTWMQTIAQSWLVLSLTHSATLVGAAVAIQTLPVLLLGPYAGVVADRIDKRRLMIILQAMMGLQALVLGLLTVTHVVRVWEVFVLAAVLGLNNAFENPARQSFVLELVGREHVRNAVSLNSVMVNVARAIGPAVAGIIIASGGIGFCFLLNSASFVAVVVSLLRLDVSALQPSEPAGRAKGQLREGIRYVIANRDLGVPLLMMALVGCLAFEFQVVLPVLAKHDFHGNSVTYGFITSAMGVGAIIGGLWVAARGRTGSKVLMQTCLWFCVAMFAAAFAPDLALELVAIAFVGAFSIACLSQGNSTLQLAAAPSMRGRVMALWAVAFLGSTPIGGPIAGAVSEHWGGRGGLVLGAVACLLAALLGWVLLRRDDPVTTNPRRVETAV
jgi:MFS family permease